MSQSWSERPKHEITTFGAQRNQACAAYPRQVIYGQPLANLQERHILITLDIHLCFSIKVRVAFTYILNCLARQ